MPLPLGHAAIGWATYETHRTALSQNIPQTPLLRLVHLGFAIFLANLPDLDVLFGLIFYGNGSAVHRGPTHSLVFALLAGYLASKLWRLWPLFPRWGFGLCFSLIFSHVVADMVLTSTPVSLLWPFGLYLSPGHAGWGQVTHMVLFRSIQDAGILVISMLYVLVFRLSRSKAPLFPLFAFAKRRVK